MSRPEHLAPPEIFYDDKEAEKYASNSRMIEIQTTMSERAVELLNLPDEGCFYVLDIGCGSGLSGTVLSEQGHVWVGVDISPSMLRVAHEREVEGDLVVRDMGHGMPFRPATFDAAISVSALQWLCNADKKDHNPKHRLNVFFQSLYNCLNRGARAVLQFYPENPAQMEMVTTSAMKCGFTGGLVVDFPNSAKAKKYFLVLFAGASGNNQELPKAIGVDEEEDAVPYAARERPRGKKDRDGSRSAVKTRDWVVKKKETQRKQGKKVAADSKYTGRRRPKAF